MNTTYFLPMTKSFKWVTFLAMILILVGLGYMLYAWILEHDIEMLIGIIVIVLVVGGTLCMIPRRVSVSKNHIDIHMLAWKVRVASEDVVKIEHYPHGIETHRIVGAGMFFGNIGVFTSSECGKHFSLVTDPTDVCIITRKSKMPIAVSIKDNSVFKAIAEVHEKD